MNDRLDQALRGVIPPMITPLHPDGTLDEASFLRQARHCLDAGCTGLFIAGSTGEGPWLTAAQRRRAIELAVGTGTVVLAGVMMPGTAMTVEAALGAESAGADAIVVSAPYYFRADEDMTVRHVEAVASKVGAPIVLYNIPSTTHNPMTAGAVARLAADPSVIGIKDSSGDLDLFRAHLALRGEHAFRVLQGSETVMADSLRSGADGLVPGLANVAPHLFVRLVEGVRAGDDAAVRSLESQIAGLRGLYAIATTYAAVKAACSILGTCGRTPVAPLAAATDDETGRIAELLRGLDLAPGTAA